MKYASGQKVFIKSKNKVGVISFCYPNYKGNGKDGYTVEFQYGKSVVNRFFYENEIAEYSQISLFDF